MWIGMRLTAAGPRFTHGGLNAGHVYDVPEADAIAFLEAGVAEKAEAPGRKVVEQKATSSDGDELAIIGAAEDVARDAMALQSALTPQSGAPEGEGPSLIEQLTGGEASADASDTNDAEEFTQNDVSAPKEAKKAKGKK